MRRTIAVGLLALVLAGGAAPLAGAAPAGELGGTVRGDGAPVESVCVEAISFDGGGFGGDVTDADGRYRIVGLAPGGYVLLFADCDPDPRYAPTQAEATVAPGQAAQVDVRLVRGATLVGEVTGPDGPAAGICVEVLSPEVGLVAFGQVVAVTGRDGAYRSSPIEPGSYVVRFSDCRPEPVLVAEHHGDVVDPSAATTVRLGSGSTRTIDAALAEGGRLTGRVTDPRGAPFSGACVLAVSDGLQLGAAFAVAATDGSFTVGGLTDGLYRVHATRCTAAEAQAALAGSSFGEDADVDLGEANEVGPLRLAAGEVARVAGADRVATAAAIAARTTLPDTGFGATVVLVRSDRPSDAVVAGPLATAYDAPLLLTDGRTLSAEVVAVLERAGVTDALLVGGFAAIGAPVEARLSDLGVATRRIAGSDRYETAAAIAADIGAETAMLVRGDRWEDALAVSGSGVGEPILLTDPARLPAATRSALTGLRSLTIVGGSGAVSHAVQDEVAAIVPFVGRIAGGDRYETAVRLLELVQPSFAEVWVAPGDRWSDGLAAGAAAGRTNAAFVLLPDGPLASSATGRELLEHAADLTTVVVSGGDSGVSPTTFEELRSLVPSTCDRSERC